MNQKMLRRIDRIFNGAWASQIAEVVRQAWSCEKGVYHFPYYRLKESGYWAGEMAGLMDSGKMYSWVRMMNGEIVAHVSLMQIDDVHGTYWEMGRMVCHPAYQKRGFMSRLVREADYFARKNDIRYVVECTQANTHSQALCYHVLKLRFAGIGILDKGLKTDVTKASWDIIYFDNHPVKNFEPLPGVLNNALEQVHMVESNDFRRLQEIGHIISSDHGGQLPPTRFHILPEFEQAVSQIISCNQNVEPQYGAV